MQQLHPFLLWKISKACVERLDGFREVIIYKGGKSLPSAGKIPWTRNKEQGFFVGQFKSIL